MNDQRRRHPPGCDQCRPDDPRAAHAAFTDLGGYRRLIDENHYIVTLRTCAACGQQYVAVFTELIDWKHGEDPQHRVILPVTDAEAAALEQLGGAVSKSHLEALGPDRESLHMDWPSDGEQRYWWGTGLRVGYHD